MRCRFAALLVLLFGLSFGASPALAGGGHYVFAGGTNAQQATVRAGLDASAFNWNLVPATITVHIGDYAESEATRGELWLDRNLLDSGIYSWGVIQHEYGHQVDYFMLTDPMRATLKSGLGGISWWQTGGIAHGNLTCERFASTIAWAYWPSRYNVMKPQSRKDEAGHVAPQTFRQSLKHLLGVPDTLTKQK